MKKPDDHLRKEMMLSIKTLLDLSGKDGQKTWHRLVNLILKYRFRPESVAAQPEDAILDDILKMLIFKIDTKLRTKVSEHLAAAKEPPQDLVTLLAQDESDVAAPILRRCKSVSDSILVSVIKKKTEAHRRAICDRTALLPQVVDALIEKGQEKLLVALLEKEDLSLTDQNIESLLKKSNQLAEITDPLLRHKDIRHIDAYQIFWWGSEDERNYILENFAPNPEKFGQVLESIFETDGKCDSQQQALASAIDVIDKAQSLRDRNFFLMQTDDMQQLLNALVSHLELEGDLVRRTLLDKGYESLAILCRALGITKECYLALAKHLNPRLIKQFGENESPPELNLIYQDMRPEHAAIIVAIWQLQCIFEHQNSSQITAFAA